MNIPNYEKDNTGESYLMQMALQQLGFYQGKLDNDFGAKSKAALAAYRLAVSIGDAEAKPADPVLTENFSSKALALIAEYEGFDQPGKWPGGASGVTIGVGYDLGYTTLNTFRSDWGAYLSESELDRLDDAIGAKGEHAHDFAYHFTDIRIDHVAALEVFNSRTIPTYTARAFAAFPGLGRLPLDAQGAIVSIVFNRGESMTGDNRLEMREIRDLISSDRPVPEILPKIAGKIREMKRIWVGKGLDGLLRRRDAEAKLVEGAA